MNKLIKPIPGHHFHKDTDQVLVDLIRVWRRNIEEGDPNDKAMKSLIDDAYRVLGYRCALECINKYGD